MDGVDWTGTRPKKQNPPTRDIELLGAPLSFAPGCATASLPDAKRESLAADLKQLRARGTLGTADAAKVRGRLGYSQSLLFGRAGRVMLQPFTECQYNARADTRSALPPSINEVIPWWVARLNSSECRTVSTVKQMPVLVYTDASGAGHISAIAIVGGVRHTVHTHAPEWFMRCGAGIFELELLGELLGLFLACEVAPGRPVLLCCDNSGAAATVVMGLAPQSHRGNHRIRFLRRGGRIPLPCVDRKGSLGAKSCG